MMMGTVVRALAFIRAFFDRRHSISMKYQRQSINIYRSLYIHIVHAHVIYITLLLIYGWKYKAFRCHEIDILIIRPVCSVSFTQSQCHSINQLLLYTKTWSSSSSLRKRWITLFPLFFCVLKWLWSNGLLTHGILAAIERVRV